HDQIESAVVVEIGIRGTIGKPRLVHPPGVALVDKREIALIPEEIVRQLVTAQLPQQLQSSPTSGLLISSPLHSEHGCLVIKISDGLGIAVGDEDVLVPIVVDVREQ